MGRRALHLCLADRQAAAREKQHNRRVSAHSKDLARTQRHTAYWRKNGRQGSSTRPRPQVTQSPIPKHLLQASEGAVDCPQPDLVAMALLPMPETSSPSPASEPLRRIPEAPVRGQGSSTQAGIDPPPPDLVTTALLPMPETSTFFLQASRSADLLDETGLDMWDAGPPYVTTLLSNTPYEMQFTKRLEQVVHGRRTRLLRAREMMQEDLPLPVLQEALAQAVHEWEAGAAFISLYREFEDGHREREMARVWLQWLARECYSLYLRLYVHYINLVAHLRAPTENSWTLPNNDRMVPADCTPPVEDTIVPRRNHVKWVLCLLWNGVGWRDAEKASRGPLRRRRGLGDIEIVRGDL
ncbi:hypothetical protein FPV67DRAFT_1456635 [Lyophyllum atratum]|nr:hypothetical protein FPV67DRAFT_1458231 [Lyophyllum atratum]KAF8056497.1 hypothetical protein FPV67DRAFT_1456635 [Lyophyllum atratum]